MKVSDVTNVTEGIAHWYAFWTQTTVLLKPCASLCRVRKGLHVLRVMAYFFSAFPSLAICRLGRVQIVFFFFFNWDRYWIFLYSYKCSWAFSQVTWNQFDSFGSCFYDWVQSLAYSRTGCSPQLRQDLAERYLLPHGLGASSIWWVGTGTVPSPITVTSNAFEWFFPGLE